MEEIPPSNPRLILLTTLDPNSSSLLGRLSLLIIPSVFSFSGISNHSFSTSSFPLWIKCTQTSPIVEKKKKNPSTLLSLPVNTLLLSYHTEVCCKSCYTYYFSFISHLILNPITSSFLPPQLWNYFLYIYQSFVNEIDKHLVMRKDVLIQYWVKR